MNDNTNEVSTNTAEEETKETKEATAEETKESTEAANGSEVNYDKLEKLIEKTTAKKENAVMKSYFQQLGLSEEEAKEAIKQFKETKASKSQETKEKVNTFAEENSQLKQRLMSVTIESKAKDIAGELGVDKKAIPYIIKMADISNVANEDGTVNEKELTDALNNVVDAIPSLKVQASKTGTFQLGANNDKNADEEDKNSLRNAFGLR